MCPAADIRLRAPATANCSHRPEPPSLKRWPKSVVREGSCQTRSTGTANTYPTPRSVWMTRGALGSRSSLRRRRRICTSMLRSKTSSCTRVACSRCSRLSGRCGASRKASNNAYSPLVKVTGAPSGSVSCRVFRSSCQPENRKRPRSDCAPERRLLSRTVVTPRARARAIRAD